MTREAQGCACRRRDAYECWAARYPQASSTDDPLDEFEEIEAQGGPCDCPCHDSAADREFREVFS